MKEDVYLQFAADYTEAMKSEVPQSGGVQDVYPDDPAEIRTLFALSETLRSVLVPVKAPSFQVSLRRRIEKRQLKKPRFKVLASQQNVVWIVVAAAGSLLSLTGVVVIIARKLRSSSKLERRVATSPI